jgi:hypothetical protein
MERRRPKEIHPHVVPRQVIASGQPGLVELHGPIGSGEQPAAQPDFHVSEGWGDVDRVAYRHICFNGSGDIAIPLPGVGIDLLVIHRGPLTSINPALVAACRGR